MCQKDGTLPFSSSFVYNGAQILLGGSYSVGIISMSSHMRTGISSIFVEFVCFSEKSP